MYLLTFRPDNCQTFEIKTYLKNDAAERSKTKTTVRSIMMKTKENLSATKITSRTQQRLIHNVIKKSEENVENCRPQMTLKVRVQGSKVRMRLVDKNGRHQGKRQ